MEFKEIKNGGESPTEKSSDQGPDASSPGAIHTSPPILFENLEETLPLKYCLDFIVNNHLGPEFQRDLDERGVDFSIEEYYNKR